MSDWRERVIPSRSDSADVLAWWLAITWRLAALTVVSYVLFLLTVWAVPNSAAYYPVVVVFTKWLLLALAWVYFETRLYHWLTAHVDFVGGDT